MLKLICFVYVISNFYMPKPEKRVLRLLWYSLPFAVFAFGLIVSGASVWRVCTFLVACVVMHTVSELIFCKAGNERAAYVVYHAVQIVLMFIGYDLLLRIIGFELGIVFGNVLNYGLFGILVLRPANISMQRLFASFAPTSNGEEGRKGAGAMIGNMERFAMGLFLIIGQYEAIGLILTAKSIARYKKICDDKEFSEYYIIGTLFSLIYTICAYYMVFGIK